VEGGRVLAIVYFRADEATLVEEYRPALELAGEYLRRNPGASLMIRGYTAPAGIDANRMALAEARANYCRDYLVRRYGIDAGRLHTEWYGARRLPQAATEGNWPLRRAAELVIEVIEQ
jgi:outer membrane protein OmpA-like peptidoglycan-associated protein